MGRSLLGDTGRLLLGTVAIRSLNVSLYGQHLTMRTLATITVCMYVCIEVAR